MGDAAGKLEPWQPLMILVLVLALFGGLYFINEALSARLDAIEQTIESNSAGLKAAVSRVESRLSSIPATVQAGAAPSTTAAQRADAGTGGPGAADPL